MSGADPRNNYFVNSFAQAVQDLRGLNTFRDFQIGDGHYRLFYGPPNGWRIYPCDSGLNIVLAQRIGFGDDEFALLIYLASLTDGSNADGH